MLSDVNLGTHKFLMFNVSFSFYTLYSL